MVWLAVFGNKQRSALFYGLTMGLNRRRLLFLRHLVNIAGCDSYLRPRINKFQTLMTKVRIVQLGIVPLLPHQLLVIALLDDAVERGGRPGNEPDAKAGDCRPFDLRQRWHAGHRQHHSYQCTKNDQLDDARFGQGVELAQHGDCLGSAHVRGLDGHVATPVVLGLAAVGARLPVPLRATVQAKTTTRPAAPPV